MSNMQRKVLNLIIWLYFKDGNKTTNVFFFYKFSCYFCILLKLSRLSDYIYSKVDIYKYACSIMCCMLQKCLRSLIIISILCYIQVLGIDRINNIQYVKRKAVKSGTIWRHNLTINKNNTNLITHFKFLYYYLLHSYSMQCMRSIAVVDSLN